MEEMRIIDSHSHIGKGFIDTPATIEEYEVVRKHFSITTSLLMPQPIMDSKIERSTELFMKINEDVSKQISGCAIKDSIHFIPIFSPVYMSPKELEELIEIYQPKALKVHYKNDDSHPWLISEGHIKVLLKHDIPLIVHTDYSPNRGNYKDDLKNMNSGLEWYQFLTWKGLRGYLTHGARLNREVLDKVNKADNIVIGMGPDMMLQDYAVSGLEQRNYLETLYNQVDPSKLVFDLDYNWNLNKNNELEYGSIDRLGEFYKEDELRLILGKNSERFFKI